MVRHRYSIADISCWCGRIIQHGDIFEGSASWCPEHGENWEAMKEEQKKLDAGEECREGVRTDGKNGRPRAVADERRLNAAVDRAIRDHWDAIKELAKH